MLKMFRADFLSKADVTGKRSRRKGGTTTLNCSASTDAMNAAEMMLANNMALPQRKRRRGVVMVGLSA